MAAIAGWLNGLDSGGIGNLISSLFDALHGGAKTNVWDLALLQGNKSGFSVPVVFRGKAQCAGNGCSIAKHCNAGAEHHRSARRVVPPPGHKRLLTRAQAIACEARLKCSDNRRHYL